MGVSLRLLVWTVSLWFFSWFFFLVFIAIKKYLKNYLSGISIIPYPHIFVIIKKKYLGWLYFHFYFYFYSMICDRSSWLSIRLALLVGSCIVYGTHKLPFLPKFSLKISLIVLFTHLKIILLQCFSVFSYIQMDS